MKAKVQIKSIFEQIAEKVFVMNNINEVKAFVKSFVEGKNINNVDKNMDFIQMVYIYNFWILDKNIILMNVEKCKNVPSVHRYICNSLFKYEGMSVAN